MSYLSKFGFKVDVNTLHHFHLDCWKTHEQFQENNLDCSVLESQGPPWKQEAGPGQLRAAGKSG